jgi:hypothetical protein
MNPHLTEIAYILDRSGSMQPMRDAAVAAFNDFINSQLDVSGDARLTLVLFDDQYETPVTGRFIQDVPPLTSETYVPRSRTALLDAIGKTTTEMVVPLAALPEAEKPGKVISAFFKVGLEYASWNFNNKLVSDLIHKQSKEDNWEFLFLAANQGAFATANESTLRGLGLRMCGIRCRDRDQP